MKEGIGMQEMPVAIDVALPSDAREIAELKFANLMHRASTGELEMSPEDREHEEVTDESVSKLSEMLGRTDREDFYLVAKNEGSVVGFCRMTWRPDSHQYQFRQFYVRPQFIGQKIGSKLMAAAKDRAQHSEFAPKGMFLYTGDYNRAAQSMYEHWGFRRASSNESQFGQQDENRIEWIKMVLDF